MNESADRVAEPFSLDQLVERASGLAAPGRRRLLGITGAPGAGKSTLAVQVVDALGDSAALVSMDGFHLANAVLLALGRRDRKGAADTFDVAGYVALLERVRTQTDDIIYAPEFDRALEESVGSAIPIATDTPLIVTEGNYLLLEEGGWQHVKALLDETWFVDPSEQVRQQWLIRRHEQYGLSHERARQWALGTDQRNAELVNRTRAAATLVISVIDPGLPAQPAPSPLR